MQLLRKKAPTDQLDLLDANRAEASQTIAASDVCQASAPPSLPEPATTAKFVANGLPLVVPIVSIDEDPSNPRTEFPDAEIEELAEDIRQHFQGAVVWNVPNSTITTHEYPLVVDVDLDGHADMVTVGNDNYPWPGQTVAIHGVRVFQDLDNS